MGFVYKIAETPSEFEQIHTLNYRTFVEEIPQHERNASHQLIDKFHDENTYIICLKDERLIGMIAVRSKRPFSLDAKIGLVEHHLPVEITNPVEIRLLAIERAYRNGRAFLGLAQALVRYCLKVGYDAALISGTVREQKLYGQLGFLPFARLTGTAEAAFQPMYLTKTTFDAGPAGRISRRHVNFLPGPATIAEDVKKAMLAEPLSHRSSEFDGVLARVKSSLLSLTGARHVQLLQGTGTLANDVVAGQLHRRGGKGLILVNGEFGVRLMDHARRLGLSYDTLEIAWGETFSEQDIRHLLTTNDYCWLWIVQCETSTGVLNDLEIVTQLCSEYGLTLAVDCISAIGTVPVDLTAVDFASGVSGKGLLSYTGLSFVFHKEDVPKSDDLPRYIDLGAYVEEQGVPYTQSSNLVAALDVALRRYASAEDVFIQIGKRAEKVWTAVEDAGLTIVADLASSSPAIMTIGMPAGMSAMQLGDNLFLNGFNLHYESAYLRERNWLQIACMNEVKEKEVERMLDLLRILTARTLIKK
ncbi:aminotransferase class V-fold PLP-dependent enzyme [Sporosarcina sp. FSL K6-1522]|uniref:aminotransferase class V-fold PLP-dependent enzyme n=1 Tax=Sporosarcina sp. FSL K6-1522 TaxID=2921554 RepID=UPI00315A4C10